MAEARWALLGVRLTSSSCTRWGCGEPIRTRAPLAKRRQSYLSKSGHNRGALCGLRRGGHLLVDDSLSDAAA